jgi:hypothetical protein
MENKNATPAPELLTNKSAGALLRESELELVNRAEKPLNLKTLITSRLENYIGRDVTIPDEVAEYVKTWGPVKEGEDRTQIIHALEETVEKFHGVKPPFYIYMSITLQQTGRPWAYVPEAGKLMTGFVLGKINPDGGLRPNGNKPFWKIRNTLCKN